MNARESDDGPARSLWRSAWAVAPLRQSDHMATRAEALPEDGEMFDGAASTARRWRPDINALAGLYKETA